MDTALQNKARKLYFQTDLTKTDIANALGIPRRTLHHWIREQNWAYQKQCASHMPVLIAENCYHILANYTTLLLAPDRKDVLISSSEVNTIYKLTTAIGKLKTRTTLNEKMEVLAGFINAVNGAAPDMAQALSPLVSEYIAAGAMPSVTVQAAGSAPSSPAELDAEQQLDQQYDTEDSIPTSAATFSPVTISGRHTLATQRRQSPPPYHEFLADLRRQDEHVRHLFPVNTRYASAKAA